MGDGPDKLKLERMISTLESARYVQIIPKVDQDKLFEYICSSWLGVGPALTEFNPNFILECLSFGKPVLISRENGLSVNLPDEFLFDPSDENEFEIKFEHFFNADFYKAALEKISKLDLNHGWEEVIKAHLKLLQIGNA